MQIHRFILRISLFIIAFIAFASALYIVSDICINFRKQHFLALKKNITIIFSGDSNIECAINDSLIPHSINIAQSGEAYLYTYVKLKALLEYNKQIKTIFVGFSFHTLDKSYDDLWLFDNEFVIEKNKSYNYLLGLNEKKIIFMNNPKSYLQGITECIKENFVVIGKSYFSGTINNFGGYRYLVRDKLQKNIALIDSLKKNDFHFDEGKNQIKYVKLISDLCRQNNVKLILLNVPKHKVYTKSFNYNIKDYGMTVQSVLMQDSLLDLSAMPLNDSCYGDVTHLNYKGAIVFSRYLNARIHSH